MTTLLFPLAYALTIGTAQQQILALNPSRKALIFVNVGTVNVAIAPAFANVGGVPTPLVCTINGPGCLTLTSAGNFVLPQPGWPEVALGAAFNAIAAAPATPFTVWEF
ncbi:MAG TPA: hypothetical protein VF753_09870 [Terriglobales bacterium]